MVSAAHLPNKVATNHQTYPRYEIIGPEFQELEVYVLPVADLRR